MAGLTDEERQTAIDIIADAQKRRATVKDGVIKQKIPVTVPIIMKGNKIDLEHVEKIDFIIDNLLAPGLSMLAADPKAGKSWFALLMCLCVAQGQKFLDYNTKKCTCLYFALEDSDNRVKNRIKKIYDGEKLPNTFNYSISVNDLSNGLIEQLELVYESMRDLRLIVIDTLQCIRGQYNNRDGGAYGYDYKEMNKLKEFSKKHNLSILLLHHTSKMDNPNDPFFSISGTRGITGALDLMMIIKKEDAMNKQAKLYIRGRDIDDDAFIIELRDCKWIKIGTLEDWERKDAFIRYKENPVVAAINAAVAGNGTWRGRMSELIEFAESKGIHINETPQRLANTVCKLKYDLEMYDGIQYGTILKGKASKIHVFRAKSVPFK